MAEELQQPNNTDNSSEENNGERKITEGMLHQLKELIGSRRWEFMQAMGMYRGSDGTAQRNVWAELGYPTEISLQDYAQMYERHDIAGTVVEIYPDAVWGDPPEVYDSPNDNKTQFEKDWEELQNRIPIWSYMRRLDILAGIGDYAGLLIGFKDGKKLKSPAGGDAETVQYLQPYDQLHLEILNTEKDARNERYGLPTLYREKFDHMKIHHSRMLHVADQKLVSDTYGRSRMKGVYNRLMDIEQVAGSGRESVWRNAIRKLFLNRPTNSQIRDQSKFEQELADFQHELSRVLDLRGIEAKESEVQVADAAPVFNMLIACVCARQRIPRRKLLGTETGEQSSEQDENAWLAEVDKRRRNFAQPDILEPFINMCINAGAIAPPSKGLKIKWPELHRASDETRSTIINRKTEALTRFVTNGGSSIMTPYDYFTKVWELSDEDATAILEAVRQVAEDEDDEIRKAVEEQEGNEDQG